MVKYWTNMFQNIIFELGCLFATIATPSYFLMWTSEEFEVFPAFSSLLSSGSLAPPAAHGNRREVLYGAGHLWGLSDAPCESWGERGGQQGDHFRRSFWGTLWFFVEVKQRELRWIETIETIRNWITGKIEMFWMDVLSSEWILGGCTLDLYAFIESTGVNSSCSAGVRCLLLLSGAGKSNELRLWLGYEPRVKGLGEVILSCGWWLRTEMPWSLVDLPIILLAYWRFPETMDPRNHHWLPHENDQSGQAQVGNVYISDDKGWGLLGGHGEGKYP